MIEIVIFGTARTVVTQRELLERLVKKYKIKPGFNRDIAHTNRWGPGDGIESLICCHYELEGATTHGVKEDFPFLVEAMALGGVYLECPECAKRRFWEKQAEALASTISA